MSWGRFFFELYVCKDEPGKLKAKDLAFFGMSNSDEVKEHRDNVAKYLQELDKALAENNPDDLYIVMNS